MKRRLLHVPAGWVWAFLLAFSALTSCLVHFIPGSIPVFILATVWLFVLPGWLITKIIRMHNSNLWEHLGFSVGFSLLAVILTSLAINTVLPLLGHPHPLSTNNLLIGLNAVWLALMATAWITNRGEPVEISLVKYRALDMVFMLSVVPIVILAVLGAVSLNNGGSNIFTYLMLAICALFLGGLLRYRDQVHESTILSGIYGVGLALLLMTSLRGWFTTGHDVQREYQVFMLTLGTQHWDVGALKDAYNACLSITILPTVIRQITGIGDQLVYKTVFQAIFAIVPVLVYLIARRYTSRFVALLATIYFIAFPTYFTDMPMLNRQEIAFLFLALMFLTMFNRRWSLRRQSLLVPVLGVGVVLSHYSTTYTMLGLIVLVIIIRNSLRLLATVTKHVPILRAFSRTRWRHPEPSTITVMLVASLMTASYIWSVPLTNTGGNIAKIASATVQSIRNGLAGDTKSSDTNYSFFGGSKLNDQQRLNAYTKQVVETTLTTSSASSLYPKQAYANYLPVIAVESDLPLTKAGHVLDRVVPVSKFNTIVRQGSALLLQVLLGIGIIIIFLNPAFSVKYGNDYRLFQLSSIITIAAIVLLPVLSAEYGLLRAFQQTLLIGGVAIALASLFIIPKKFLKTQQIFGAACALGFFISSTGLITTTLGGYPPQLHLANGGKYYDLYYAHAGERQGIEWLAATMSANREAAQSGASADRYTAGLMKQFTDIDYVGDIYPGSLHRDSYVFLGFTTTTKGQATANYNGDPLIYQYPVGFLDASKDLVYSTNQSKIYR
jgi:uncharacterized membrane protein